MDRRIILAVLLMIGAILIHRAFAPPLSPPPLPEEEAGSADTAGAGGPGGAATPETAVPWAPSAETAPEGAVLALTPEAGGWGDTLAVSREVVVDTELFRATFSTRGARLLSWQLKQFEGIDDAPVTELIPAVPEGALTLALVGEGGEVDLSRAVFSCDRRELRLGPGTPRGTLTMRLSGPGGVEIREVLSFSNDSYSFGLDLQAVDAAGNQYRGPERVNVRWLSGIEVTEENLENAHQYFGVMASLPSGLFKASLKDFGKTPELGRKGPVSWAAIRSKYFLIALVPRTGGAEAGFSGDKPSGRLTLLLGLTTLAELGGASEAGTPGEVSPAPYHPGDVEVYLGPMDYHLLSGYGNGLERTVNLGWRLIRPVSRLLLYCLRQIHRALPNWGLAIIVLSALTKVLFYPLTHKSVKSMRDMQKLQPKLTELREKYKNNSQRQQQEMMKLYREAGVNPLGGCMPLLLQSPVFIALYSVLNSTIDLRRAGFVLWIDDLSSPESLFQLPFSLPFLGQDFRLLPLLMGVSMLWQQRTGSPTGAGDPRMKMMGYLMPVIFTVMFYRFPSGLVLYWLVNTVLTIAQQYLIGRGDRKGVSLEPEPPKGRRRRARTPAPAPKGTDSVDAPPAPLAAGQSSRQEG